MKNAGSRKPHIAVLDADQGILEYIHHILADRFSVRLFTDAAALMRSLIGTLPKTTLRKMRWACWQRFAPLIRLCRWLCCPARRNWEK